MQRAREEGSRREAKTGLLALLLGARTLLGALGLTTRSEDTTRSKGQRYLEQRSYYNSEAFLVQPPAVPTLTGNGLGDSPNSAHSSAQSSSKFRTDCTLLAVPEIET